MVRLMERQREETAPRAYMAAMKSDLRNLATAQQSYFANNGAYTTSQSALRFRAWEGLTVTIVSADTSGFAATASHSALPEFTCSIFVGSVHRVPTAEAEGEPRCGFRE